MPGLYERILELTNKMSMTGKELGIKLGLKKSPLTDWKNKKSSPTLEQFVKMCEIFAVSPEYLLTGKEAAELTPEEQQLVDLYRRSNVTGKKLILNNAKSTSEALPAELELSASQIG